MMNIERKYLILTLCGFPVFLTFGMLIWLNISALNIIQIGQPIPEIPFFSSEGIRKTVMPYSRDTLLMIFHTDCKNCEQQFYLLNNNSASLENNQLILLTFDPSFHFESVEQNWPNLVEHSNFIWGFSEEDSLEKYLGPFGLPALFFFDECGYLKNRVIGQIKVNKLLEYLTD